MCRISSQPRAIKEAQINTWMDATLVETVVVLLVVVKIILRDISPFVVPFRKETTKVFFNAIHLFFLLFLVNRGHSPVLRLGFGNVLLLRTCTRN